MAKKQFSEVFIQGKDTVHTCGCSINSRPNTFCSKRQHK